LSGLLVQEVFDTDNEFFLKAYRIYEKAFRPELMQERSVYERTIAIKRRGLLPGQDQHILVALLDGDVVGMATLYYFHECNAGLIGYIVLDRKWRRRGLGVMLYNDLVDILKADAKRQGEPYLDAVLYEVDKAELAMTQTQRCTDLLRIRFFRSVGGRIVKAKYFQPPLRAGLSDVEMNLMVHIITPGLAVTRKWLVRVVDCIYTNVYTIESGLSTADKERYLGMLEASITGNDPELD
jgi:GNAT superfamily N-acetyltransferase